MIESGFPGLSLGFWVGLWAPAGTPPRDRRRHSTRATNAALASPEMKASMTRLGIAPSIGSVKDFADFIADEAPRWADIVKVAACRWIEAVAAAARDHAAPTVPNRSTNKTT